MVTKKEQRYLIEIEKIKRNRDAWLFAAMVFAFMLILFAISLRVQAERINDSIVLPKYSGIYNFIDGKGMNVIVFNMNNPNQANLFIKFVNYINTNSIFTSK